MSEERAIGYFVKFAPGDTVRDLNNTEWQVWQVANYDNVEGSRLKGWQALVFVPCGNVTVIPAAQLTKV